jgi:Domain of unknown function (DUF4432)
MQPKVSLDNSASRDFLVQRTGRLSQLGGITHFTHAEGKAKGVSTLRVRTAAGLELWVVPDRGMDIFEASFLGKSLSWHSPTGMVHPAYYSSRGPEWLKSFCGGLLATCGISTVGAPSDDAGESLGLHGSISNTPAEQVTWSEVWQGDDCFFTISGKVREASVHGPNLLLERNLTTSLKSTSFSIRDTVENQGPKPSPLMLLYHVNFGFPLLTERSRVYAPSRKREPATDHAARSVNQWSAFEAPIQGTDERVYFHQMEPDSTGHVTVVLVSDTDHPDFGIALSYDSATLPEFTQWKMTGTNHFVLGLEPGNCRSLGRAAERTRGTLQTLSPGERCEFYLELRILNGADQVAAAIRITESTNFA